MQMLQLGSRLIQSVSADAFMQFAVCMYTNFKLHLGSRHQTLPHWGLSCAMAEGQLQSNSIGMAAWQLDSLSS